MKTNMIDTKAELIKAIRTIQSCFEASESVRLCAAKESMADQTIIREHKRIIREQQHLLSHANRRLSIFVRDITEYHKNRGRLMTEAAALDIYHSWLKEYRALCPQPSPTSSSPHTAPANSAAARSPQGQQPAENGQDLESLLRLLETSLSGREYEFLLRGNKDTTGPWVYRVGTLLRVLYKTVSALNTKVDGMSTSAPTERPAASASAAQPSQYLSEGAD